MSRTRDLGFGEAKEFHKVIQNLFHLLVNWNKGSFRIFRKKIRMPPIFFDSPQGKKLFQYINHFANRESSPFTPNQIYWNEESRNRPFHTHEEYADYWGDAIQEYFIHWQTERFFLESWLAAKVVFNLIAGNSTDEFSGQDSQTNRLVRLVFKLLSFLSYTSDPPMSPSQVQFTSSTVVKGQKSLYASIAPTMINDSKSNKRCHATLSTNESLLNRMGDQVPNISGWNRRTVEIALHEARHFIVKCFSQIEPDSDRSIDERNHGDSPYEIDARLFQCLTYEILQVLISIKELRGTDLFPLGFGNPYIPSLIELDSKMLPLKAAVVSLKSHVEACKRDKFRYWLYSRAASVADTDLKITRIIGKAKLLIEIGSSNEADYLHQVAELKRVLQLPAGLHKRIQAHEFLGYTYRRVSAIRRQVNGNTASIASELAIHHFKHCFRSIAEARFAKYILMEARISNRDAGIPYAYWILWASLGGVFVDSWRHAYSISLKRLSEYPTLIKFHDDNLLPCLKICETYFKELITNYYRQAHLKDAGDLFDDLITQTENAIETLKIKYVEPELKFSETKRNSMFGIDPKVVGQYPLLDWLRASLAYDLFRFQIDRGLNDSFPEMDKNINSINSIFILLRIFAIFVDKSSVKYGTSSNDLLSFIEANLQRTKFLRDILESENLAKQLALNLTVFLDLMIQNCYLIVPQLTYTQPFVERWLQAIENPSRSSLNVK